MGAPLMLSNKNRSQSLENNLSDEHFDTVDTEREHTVNGKLDISIKDNSIRDKSENKAFYSNSMNDLKHNYH
jgi:hypothetical protein